MANDRLELLAEVATLYYEEGLTQEEIAHELDISRSNISRLLAEARRKGVVQITIHYPWKTVPSLQTALVERFGLTAARVLVAANRSYDQLLPGLGTLAARYLEGILPQRGVLGISWGTTIYHVVRALRPTERPEIDVVQMIGALGLGDPVIDGPELARLLAEFLGARYHYLHAPLLIEDDTAREALVHTGRIRETLDLASRADLALVGIGSIVPPLSGAIRSGYVDEEWQAVLRRHGAVGDICSQFFDIHGQPLDIPFNHWVIGVDLAEIKRIPCVIGVAGGRFKAPALRGVLRGGYLDVMVTDDEAAREVLRLDDQLTGVAEAAPALEAVLPVSNAVGLHDRPAALFVQTAASFEANIRLENLTRGTPAVNAKSILSVLSLGIEKGHQIRISAKGADEVAAIRALHGLVEDNFGESQ
jgi:deoxyribonucleoside regulator